MEIAAEKPTITPATPAMSVLPVTPRNPAWTPVISTIVRETEHDESHVAHAFLFELGDERLLVRFFVLDDLREPPPVRFGDGLRDILIFLGQHRSRASQGILS